MDPQPPETQAPDITGRLATMKDVADVAGVSRQLVSMIMRDLPGPSESTRLRVLEVASQLNFQPNISARVLRQQRTRRIGLMFRVTNPFQAQLAERFLERAKERGLGVVLAPTTAERDTETVIAELLGHRVEALACFNPSPDSPAFHRALNLIPIVWLGEKAGDPRASGVCVDDELGIALAVDHLADLGHREIAFFGGQGGAVGPAREAAYRDAMVRLGLSEYVDTVSTGFDLEDGANAARDLLTRTTLPTAIVCCSDRVAAAAKVVFLEAGVRVPDDISLVGYDDSPIANLSFNQLTSVRQDVDMTAEATLATIGERLADPTIPPRDTLISTTLTVRMSTSAPRSE